MLPALLSVLNATTAACRVVEEPKHVQQFIPSLPPRLSTKVLERTVPRICSHQLYRPPDQEEHFLALLLLSENDVLPHVEEWPHAGHQQGHQSRICVPERLHPVNNLPIGPCDHLVPERGGQVLQYCILREQTDPRQQVLVEPPDPLLEAVRELATARPLVDFVHLALVRQTGGRHLFHDSADACHYDAEETCSKHHQYD